MLVRRIPDNASVLDVGCGNGVIADLINRTNPSASFQGLEVKPRPSCLIPCIAYDGENFPVPDSCFDICMFVDVLHHTQHLGRLLNEAKRVSRRYVLIKDHLCESSADHAVLAFMDWVGNHAHGVGLTYNYQSKARWNDLFSSSGFRTVDWTENVPLYPAPFDKLFGRRLHFLGMFETR